MKASDAGLVRAVLLAHGVGERCFPFGGEASPRPKYAFEVGGAPLLTLAAKALLDAGVQEVAIVAGFRADAVDRVVEKDLPKDRVKMVVAKTYDSGDLLPAKDGLSALEGKGPALVMNADVLLGPGEVEGLVRSFSNGSGEISLALAD